MPHDKTVRLYRATAAGNVPPSLDDGELALDALSNPPRLYTPVPTSRDPSGRLDLLNMTTLGGPFLPLAGGTLDTITATTGLGLSITNSTPWGPDPGSYALNIINTANGKGINVTASAGYGIHMTTSGTAFDGIAMNHGSTGQGITVNNNNTGTGIEITSVLSAGVGLSVISGAINTAPAIRVWGPGLGARIQVGEPTGVVTGRGSVNVSDGYYVNGVRVGLPEPASAGTWLRSPGSWVPGIPTSFPSGAALNLQFPATATGTQPVRNGVLANATTIPVLNLTSYAAASAAGYTATVTGTVPAMMMAALALNFGGQQIAISATWAFGAFSVFSVTSPTAITRAADAPVTVTFEITFVTGEGPDTAITFGVPFVLQSMNEGTDGQVITKGPGDTITWATPGGSLQGQLDALAARCARLEQIVEFYVWRSRALPPMPLMAGVEHPGNGNGDGHRNGKRRKNGGGK